MAVTSLDTAETSSQARQLSPVPLTSSVPPQYAESFLSWAPESLGRRTNEPLTETNAPSSTYKGKNLATILLLIVMSTAP